MLQLHTLFKVDLGLVHIIVCSCSKFGQMEFSLRNIIFYSVYDFNLKIYETCSFKDPDLKSKRVLKIN